MLTCGFWPVVIERTYADAVYARSGVTGTFRTYSSPEGTPAPPDTLTCHTFAPCHAVPEAVTAGVPRSLARPRGIPDAPAASGIAPSPAVAMLGCSRL